MNDKVDEGTGFRDRNEGKEVGALRADAGFIKGKLDVMEKFVLSRCDPVPPLPE